MQSFHRNKSSCHRSLRVECLEQRRLLTVVDPRFGHAGAVQTNDYWADTYDIEAVDDGVFAAQANALVKYNRFGAVDSGFGAGGSGRVSFDTPLAVEVFGQSVIVGCVGSGGLQVTELAADGGLLTQFTTPNLGGAFTAGSSEFAYSYYKKRWSGDVPVGWPGGHWKETRELGGLDEGQSRLAMSVQPDGRTVVAGMVNGNGVVIRYDTNGAPDSSFGNNGVATFRHSGLRRIQDCFVSGSGATTQVVVVGVTGDDSGVLVKLSNTGAVDTSFGSGGYADFAGMPEGVVTQSTGQVVVVGTAKARSETGVTSTYDWFATQFSTAGAQQRTAYKDFGSYDFAHDVTVTSQGDVVVVGDLFDRPAESYDIDQGVWKLNASLSELYSFKSPSGNGSDPAVDAHGLTVAVDRTGGIYVGGTMANPKRDIYDEHPEVHRGPNRIRPEIIRVTGFVVNWANRGVGDGFDRVFGQGAANARQVIDSAMYAWESVVLAPGAQIPEVFPVQVSISTAIGHGGHTEWFTAQGRPTGVSITLDGGNDLTGGDGLADGGGWGLIPMNRTQASFGGVDSYARQGLNAGVQNDFDMFSVVTHELGHALGISDGAFNDALGTLQKFNAPFVPGTPFWTPAWTDPATRTVTPSAPRLDTFSSNVSSARITFTGIVDTTAVGFDPSGNPIPNNNGILYVFDGTQRDFLLTSNNGGQLPGGQDRAMPCHVAGPVTGTQNVNVNGTTYPTRPDLMKPIYTNGWRYLISDFDAAFLTDIYGYQTVSFESIPSVYSLLNAPVSSGGFGLVSPPGTDADLDRAGHLLVSGTDGTNDWIRLGFADDGISVTVDTGRVGDQFSYTYSWRDVSAISIETGAGDDRVSLEFDPGTVIPEGGIAVLTGEGDDRCVVNGSPVVLGKAITHVGGKGRDVYVHDLSGLQAGATVELEEPSLAINGVKVTTLQEVDRFELKGTGKDDRIHLKKWAHDALLEGGNGNDAFTLSVGDLNTLSGMTTVWGQGGENDRLILDDDGNSLVVDYSVTPTSVTSAASPLAPVGQTTRTFGGLTYDGSSEYLRVDSTDAANIFDVQPSLNTRYFVNGNLPAPGTVCAKNGDYLKLDTKTTFPTHPQGLDTSGRKLTVTARGNGYWDFTKTAHKRVEFESIERFNHVDIVAAGADAGTTSKPRVRVYDAETNELKFELPPEVTYGIKYRDGIRVATGDVDNDGLPDVVTAPGRLMAPTIKVFNGAPMVGLTNDNREIVAMQIRATKTYGTSFKDGVQIAVGDVVGDCLNDIVLVPSRGASQVKVFENRLAQPPVYCQWASPNAVRSINAFADYKKFIGGATVATADLNGNADRSDKQQIIVASGSGMRGLIRVFDVVASRSAYSPVRQILDPDSKFTGGLNVAVGDVDGDGIADIVTGAGNAGSAWVRTYSGKLGASSVPLKSFQAFTDLSKSAPTRVVVRDIDGDGRAEIFAAQGADGRNNYQMKRFKALTGQMVDSCLAGCPDFYGGGMFLG